jgi:hypothetical protein
MRVCAASLDPNPLVRHTFWTVVIGNFFMWLSHISANQAILQRCLALPTINKARRLAPSTFKFNHFSVNYPKFALNPGLIYFINVSSRHRFKSVNFILEIIILDYLAFGTFSFYIF